MAEPPASCRWGLMSVLMRVKNKIKELSWRRVFNWDDFPDAPLETDQWMDTQLCDADGSTSYNLGDLQHYFDAPQGFPTPPSDGSLLSQLLQGDAMTLGDEHLKYGSSPDELQQEALTTLADLGMENAQQHRQRGSIGLAFSTSEPVYALYGCASEEEYVDAETEVMHNDQWSVLQHTYSAPAQLAAGYRHSNVEMMDDGDSFDLRPVPRQCRSAMDRSQLRAIEEFLELRVGRGWTVVRRIVSALRGISGFIRGRREQRTADSIRAVVSTTPRRISRCGETTYKGIRKRKGKWVSEVRIGGTKEKVWLGSWDTEKEAALAHDAGNYHCSRKRANMEFNFEDSHRLLGAREILIHLSPGERKAKIQRLAEDHVRTYRSANIR